MLELVDFLVDSTNAAVEQRATNELQIISHRALGRYDGDDLLGWSTRPWHRRQQIVRRRRVCRQKREQEGTTNLNHRSPHGRSVIIRVCPQ